MHYLHLLGSNDLFTDKKRKKGRKESTNKTESLIWAFLKIHMEYWKMDLVTCFFQRLKQNISLIQKKAREKKKYKIGVLNKNKE